MSEQTPDQAALKAKRDAKQRESEQLMHRLIQEIDDDPNNYHTYYDLAALLVNLKSYSQAEELMMKALGYLPTRAVKLRIR